MHIFDKPPTPSCHASSIVEAANGNLIATWFGGKDEGAKDVQIWLSRQIDGQWSKPEVVGTEPGQPCWNPVLFRTNAGTLYLWYKAGPNPMSWTGYVRTSADHGQTWTKPTKMPAGFYGPVRAKPIQVGTEKTSPIFAGTSLESHQCWSPYVDVSVDDGQTWTRSTPFNVKDRFDQIQPTLFATTVDNQMTLTALMRSRKPRQICQAVSTDMGKTFTPATPTELQNPSAGIDVVRVSPQLLVLIYNPTAILRTPISLAISTDDGKTWKKALDLETEPGEYSYPAMIVSQKGMLEITYTWRRTHISHRTIDPKTL